jgi:hypothetical protein
MTTVWRDMFAASALAVLSLLIAAVDPAEAAVGAAAAVPTVATAPPLDPTANISGWEATRAMTLGWDVQHARASSEAATAHIATDGKTLYVRIDAPQRETLLAQQHANDAGDGTDDETWIDLWPNGSQGFSYSFAVNANGTHWAYSTENTGYSPTWQSYGAATAGGYTVTMAIPLHVLRGVGHNTWKAQFVRVIRATGEHQIWNYGVGQTNADDVAYAGPLTGITGASAAKPSPRAAVYGLGGLGSPDSGFSTSRLGADVSVPVTATASVYATFHPDFSNVEIDQQTISPTAYARQYNEVRPFFTQGANFYNPFNCYPCIGIQELYTPNIPTPREGYAFEGKQGQLSFAGFDAIGDGRNDAATAFAYKTPDLHWQLSTQDIAANINGVTDHTSTTSLAYNDNVHWGAYATFGSDSGSLVTDGSQAERYDGGIMYNSTTLNVVASMRKIGADYDPLDGYVQHTDIAGYAVAGTKLFQFSPNDVINAIQAGGEVDRYHEHDGLLNQTDSSGFVDLLTHSRFDANWNFGSSYLRLPDGIFTPVSQSGFALTYHSGTISNVQEPEYHGVSSTPTTFSYNTGRFGPGRVDAFTRGTTMTAGPRGILSFEADNTRDYLDPGYGPEQTQWLEKVGYSYTPSATSSFALGVRRIIGTGPTVDATVLPTYTNAYNLSFAFHKRFAHDEFYVAYGDASQLSTQPQFILKLIHYFGAQKGT